jgi:coenzyme F420-reducing hydrogenase alpha subunit
MSPERRSIRTDYLARVEGEGGMYVELHDGEVRDVKLRIYEPPRFFEAFLRGRSYTEVSDITARICGICPIAYQISSLRAVEDACGVAIDTGPIRDLRRLIYCGEWIESHALHVHLLHAPDFLGYPGFVELARDHPRIAEQGLALKKAGNDLIAVVGGREIHPINLRVGGFHRAPRPAELRPLVERLERAREIALDTVRWTSELEFPEVERDVELVALEDDPASYPVDRGPRIVSDRGLSIAPAEFYTHIAEEHVEHSNALHARIISRGAYLTGPLARFGLQMAALRPLALEAARAAGLQAPVHNPFRSIVVRAVELVEVCDEALELIAGYEPPDRPFLEVTPRAGVGHGASEAPRGLLYHRYELDAAGTILDARIVPPTSQNQLAIEQDLRAVVERHAGLDDEALTLRCEQAIRNHDPCISCATHFLELTVERR